MELDELSREIGDLLRQQGLTFGAVESATGGLISHAVTNISGSSDYYLGSVTSYSNTVKMKVIGVRAETLEKYGAVSNRVAEEMALGGRKLLGVDICIADTGIAGPGGATADKPVGLFYLGLADSDGAQNKQNAAETALLWLREYLLAL